MRRLALAIFLILIIGVVGFALYWDWHVHEELRLDECGTPAPYTVTAIERGRIVDEISQHPIIGAHITFDITNPRRTSICDDIDLNNVDHIQQVVYSDENGEFEIPGGVIEGGEIHMFVSATGCENFDKSFDTYYLRPYFYPPSTTELETFMLKCEVTS